MDGHAIWVVQCAKHFHEGDESCKFDIVYFDFILIYMPILSYTSSTSVRFYLFFGGTSFLLLLRSLCL